MDIRMVAIGGLSLLESVAMLTNHDGAYFLPVVAIIAGLAGYSVCRLQKKDCGR
jgi:hypothetical protein